MSAHSSVIALLEDVAKSLSDGYAFGYGAADEFNSIKDKAYPYIWLDPVEGSFSDGVDAKLGNTIRWDISMNFLKLDDTHGNEDETARVWEDTFAIMQKYIHKLDEFSLNVENLNVIESDKLIIKGTRFTARRKGTTDHVSGWTLTFQMETLAAFDYCSVYDGVSVVNDSLVFSDFSAVRLSDLMFKSQYDSNYDGKFDLSLLAQGGATNGQVLGWNSASSQWAPTTAGGGATPAISGSNGSFTFNTVTFGNLNGLSFYSSNGSMVGSYTVPTVPAQTAFVFSNSNGVTFGTNGSTVTASVAAQSVQTQNMVSVQGSTGNVQFANSNGVTFGFNASTITASVQTNYLTTAALSNHSHNFATTTTNGSVIVVATTNSNGATIAVPPYLTTAQPVGAYLTTARASNDAIGLNTAQTNVTWTVNSNGLSLNASGYAGTGTSATNASITLNSNGLAISVAPPGGGGLTNINISAGTTSNNLSAFTFNNANGVSFGLDGSTVTASVNAGGGATMNGYLEGFIDRELLAAQVGNNQFFIQPFNVREAIQFDEVAWINLYSNASNSSNSATLTLRVGFFTRNVNTLSLITSVSNSYAVTNSGTVGSYSIYGGLREYPLPLTTTFTAGNYWIGFLSRTTTGGGAGMTWSNYVASNINAAYSGRWSSANNATNQFAMGLGSYATTTTAIPSAVPLSQINGSAAVNARPVIFKLVSADLN